jgi:oxygen-dependent protoporphyrinogen oxidase
VNTRRAQVVVVGGGIAGLSAALALHQAGTEVLLVEAGTRLGGAIRTERADGFVIEAGPDAILAQKPDGLALCRAVGLGERIIPANPHTRAIFVLHRGRLHALPEGMMLAVPTRVWPLLRSGLFSWSGKLRMALDVVLPGRKDGADESIASLLRRRLGEEAVERLGEPLMAGIHAGDPERLSIQATFPRFSERQRPHASLIRSMREWRVPSTAPSSAFYSLAGGLEELVAAVQERIPAASIRLGARVSALCRRNGAFALTLAEATTIAAQAVIVAVPAWAAAPLLAQLSPAASLVLRTIPFASSATVALGFRRQDVAHPLDGCGLIVPRAEGLRCSACTFASVKFPGRAPEGHVLLRAFLGGERDPDVLRLDDATLAEIVRRELEPVLGLRGAPVLERVYRWPRATPQMLVGHLESMARLDAAVSQTPGLFVTGAGLHGAGLPDVIADGTRVARSAAAWLASRAVDEGSPSEARSG